MLPLVLFLTFAEFVLAFPKLPGSIHLPWKRNVFEERQAEAQPTCSCESLDPAASAFISHTPFAATASAAPTPSGYVNVFTNENTYCSAEGGLGFTTLDTYDSELCASLCESVEGCAAFTLYYEKDAANYRGTDIESSASIKCAFWAGSVSPVGSTGRGSETYNAIIAGSNGYANTVITPTGDFASAGYLGGAAIDCPDGSAEAASFITSTNVGTGSFDANLCVDPCQSVDCKFFNTYILNRNGESVGQYCDMYSAPVPASYATNVGKRDGNHNYTISSSYTFENGPSNHGEPDPPSPVSAAASTFLPATSHPHPYQSGSTVSSTYSGWTSQSEHGDPQGAAPTAPVSTPSSTLPTPQNPSGANPTTPSLSFPGTTGPTSSGWSYGAAGANASWASGQPTVVIVSTQTVIPLPTISWTSTSTTTSPTPETYTHSPTQPLDPPSSMTTTPNLGPEDPTQPSDPPSSMTTTPNLGPEDPTHSSTTPDSTTTTSSIWSADPSDPSLTSSSTTTTSQSWSSRSGSSYPYRPTTWSNSPTTTTWPDSDSAWISSSSSPSADPDFPSTTSSTDPDWPSTTSSADDPGTYTHSVITTTRMSTTSSHTRPYGSPWVSSTSSSGRPYLTTPSSSWSTTSSSTSEEIPISSTTTPIVADPTESASPNGTYPGNSTYGGGYGNYSIPSFLLNSTHLIYNATTNMVYCNWTGLWYPYTANFSLSSLNMTSGHGLNYTIPSNSTEPLNATWTSTTSEIPTSTSAPTTIDPITPTGTSMPTTNSTGFPTGYNTSIPFNMTHLTWNPSNQSWYCNLTGVWYPSSGNWTLPGFNMTDPSKNSTKINATVVSSTISPTATAAEGTSTPTDAVWSSNITSNFTGLPSGYNFTELPLNMSHMIYSPSNSSWYCELTHQWYPANSNFSLPGMNFTDPYANSSYPSNTTSSSASPLLTSTISSTVADPTSISFNSTILSNATGYPVGYNTSVPFNLTHMIYSPSNNSWYCELTHQWCSAGSNTSWAGFNFTEPYTNSTAVSNTTSSLSLPTSTSTSPSVADPTSASANSTGYNNSTGYPIGYNTSIPFNMTHMVYSPSNNSWYCELTHQWYPASGNFSLSGLNFTLPSYNNTMNSTNATAPIATPDATVTPSTSSTAADPTSTVSNSTGMTYSSYNSTGLWNMTNFNSSHLVYSASNNSVFCTITGLWYPAGNFSMASLNLTGNYSMDPGYSLNYTIPSNTTDAPVNSSVPSQTSTSPEVPSSTPAPDNSSVLSNSTGVVYPSYNYSIPFNTSHMIYAPSNNSFYCELTHQWYPAGNLSNISGFNMSAYAIFNGTLPAYNYTLPSYNYTLPSNTTVNATSTSVDPSTSDTPTATSSPDNSTVGTNYTSGYNHTGIFPPSFNTSASNSSHLHFAANGSVYCDITQQWYLPNDTTWASLLNSTYPTFNASAYGSNSTYGSTYNTNTTASMNTTVPDSPTAPTLGSLPADASAVYVTVNAASSLRKRTVEYLGFSGFEGILVESSSQASQFYIVEGFMLDAGNGQYVGTSSTSGSVGIQEFADSEQASSNWAVSGSSLSFQGATFCYTTDQALFVVFPGSSPPDGCTLAALSFAPVSSNISTSSAAPTATPVPSSNNTISNSTGVFPTYNATYSVPSFNASALNASHLIYAANGSVYCEITQHWYLPNDTSWMALLNSTYPSFNASAYGTYNNSNYSLNSTYTNTTDINATATSTSPSTDDTPPPTPATDPSSNTTLTNTTGIYPQYNSTVSSFNVSASNSTDHLIYYANGSVWCDYTHKLYAANDTSWMSLLNYTSGGYNSSYYAGNNSSAYAGFNSTAYSLNSTAVNATATSTPSAEPTVTATPELVVNSTDPNVNNTTFSNTTGIFPQYNYTSPSFNASMINSTDHLIFYANGSVWCDYTQELYPANDSSWKSLLNSTSSGFNASAYGGLNSTGFNTGYSYNATYLNSTIPVNNTTATNETTSVGPTDTSVPEPVSNSTDPVANTTSMMNSTGVFPSYNGTFINLLNSSASNSSDHLIFYANGSVYCNYTNQLYPANDTSWKLLFNTTSPGFNASAYGISNSTGFNSTGYSYNATYLNSTAPADNATTTISPSDTSTPTPTADSVANSTEPVANVTFPANSTGVFPSYNGTFFNPFNSSVANSSDHLVFYANGSVYCEYTHQLYPANDTSWMNATYSSVNSTGYNYNATASFNATGYSYNPTSLNSTISFDNSTTAEPSPTSSTPPVADTPTPTPDSVPADNSTFPSNVTAAFLGLNSTGVFPSYSYNGSTIINSTDHLIFYANGSVYCEDTQQLYPANDTSWMNVTSGYAMLNSTGAGYAPTNVTGTGYSYPSVDPSSGVDVPTPVIPAPALIASPTGYVAPTAASYDNGTAPWTNGTSNATSEDAVVEPLKVRRWKAPKERLWVRR